MQLLADAAEDPVDPTGPTDPTDPNDPNDPTDPTNPEDPDVTAGEAQYQTQCAGCHGETADGNPIGVALDVPLDSQATIAKIASAMPPGTPDNCGVDCATDVVDYLRATYWKPSPGGPGDEEPDQPDEPGEPGETPVLGDGLDPVGDCTDEIDLTGPVLSNGLGFGPTNTRNAMSSITAGNVADLAFEYAHVSPGTTTKRGAPTVASEAIFFYGTNEVYAADQETGCKYWTYETGEAELRSSSVLFVPDNETVFVGDKTGYVHAVDARTGELRWKKFAGIAGSATSAAGHMLTGGMQYHNGKLIVPVSSTEVFTPTTDPCCDNHGIVKALDAVSGDDLWEYHTTEPSVIYGEYQGPSGAPVWSTPTLDVERNAVYFGTGQNYSEPASDTSDSIIAVDLDTGREKWVFQARAGDVWVLHTSAVRTGLDFDFGASPILLDDGSALIAGDKGGSVYSLDPDTGALNWRRQIGVGSVLGGVHWNMAADGEKVYVGIADKARQIVDPDNAVDGEARPGVYALELATGEIVWEVHPTHSYRGDAVNSSFSAAVTVTNDVVFAGSLDGMLRAFRSDDGAELWSFDTAVAVRGIDGELGNGGTIDSVGPVIIPDGLLINSGYSIGGGASRYQAGPGNALFILKLKQ